LATSSEKKLKKLFGLPKPPRNAQNGHRIQHYFKIVQDIAHFRVGIGNPYPNGTYINVLTSANGD
jgi:hypothetical protein